MPPVGIAVSAWVLAALASSGVAGAIGLTATGIIVGLAGLAAIVGVSMLPGLVIGGINKLFAKGPIDPGRSVNVRQPNAARRTVYGHVRVGGTITFVHISPRGDSPNNDLHIVYTLSGHPLHSFDGVLVNGKALTFGSQNSQTPYPGHNVGYYPALNAYNLNLWAQWKLGKLSDVGFTGLKYATSIDGSNLWTSAHRQDGCGGIEVLLTWNTNIYPNGVPPLLFDVHGKELYDVRDGTTAYSENPALAAYDYLTNKEYGMGADPSEINLASFISAANTCDENISLKAGGTEDRYKINGTFAWDAQPVDVLKAIANCMAGFIAYSQGQWTCIAGVWGSPVLHIGDDDLRAPTKIQTLRSKRDLCNGVRGTIFSPLRNWQKVDFPAVYHPEHVCDDSGFPNANQTGAWVTAHSYSANDAATDISARQLKGPWVTATAYIINDYVSNGGSIYVCIANNTAGATNEPGVGASWTTYWVDNTAEYTAQVGAIFVCKLAHTSSADKRPGRGANWTTYWDEAKELIWKDLDLPFTISSPTAQRIAKIELERVRRQISIVLPCKLTAYPLQPGDIFPYTHARFGWTDKTFQVMQTNFVIEQGQDGPVIGIDIYANEIDAAVFAWDPATEEQALGTPAQPTMPDSEVPGRDFYVYGPGMTYSSTTASVTWTWDYTPPNQIILLDNQNTEFSPAGTQAVTGLDLGTGYLWYPYYDKILAQVSFLLTTETGSGTPAWAHMAEWKTGRAYGLGNRVLHNSSGVYAYSWPCYVCKLAHTASATSEPGVGATWTTYWDPDISIKRYLVAEWQRDGHLALSINPMVAATTSSGGGGGGGGGDGGCLRKGMLVKELARGIIPCDQVRIGDMLWTESDKWVLVCAARLAPHDLWCSLRFNNGAELVVTTSHPFTLDDDRTAMRKACEMTMESAVPSPTGVACPEKIELLRSMGEKVSIRLAEPHTFFASSDGENWVLTHNSGTPNLT